MEHRKYPPDCGSCKFWESRGVQPGSDRGEQIGECRHHAPMLVMIGALQQSRFPMTSELDWCGDWQSGIGQ
jgi:hypothetical protein